MLERFFSRFTSRSSPQENNKKEPIKHHSQATTKNQKNLDEAHFPHDETPEEFECQLLNEIMDDPYEIDGQYKVDYRVLQKTWAATQVNTNPFYGNYKITSLKPLPELKKRIDDFVARMCVFYPAFIKIKLDAEKCSHRYKNRQRLSEINHPLTLVPQEFKDSLFNSVINYPVILDGIHVVDLFELITWWNENPKNNKFINPYTQDYLSKIEFDEKLYGRLENYLNSLCVPPNEPMLVEQINTIESHVKTFNNEKTSDERLKRLGSVDKIPENFIGINFEHKVMNHPVILDDHYVVDYHQLVSWWKEKPENKYKNFYTGLPIKSIKYHDELKKQIDTFCDEQEKSKWAIIPLPSRKFIASPLRLFNHAAGIQSILLNGSPMMTRASLMNINGEDFAGRKCLK